jgi:Holliday junction resolvase RusA-like endonuclease
VISFFVPGKPQTAGSKTAVPMGSRMGVVEAGTKESRARKKTWRGDLRDAATDAHGMALLDGPLTLTIVIVRRRPSAHVGTGRNAGVVKGWARGLRPVERPDTVKIVRAAEDALTGYLWIDDSQIVEHRLFKAFGDQVGLPPVVEGLYVSVEETWSYGGPSLVLEMAA